MNNFSFRARGKTAEGNTFRTSGSVLASDALVAATRAAEVIKQTFGVNAQSIDVRQLKQKITKGER